MVPKLDDWDENQRQQHAEQQRNEGVSVQRLEDSVRVQVDDMCVVVVCPVIQAGREVHIRRMRDASDMVGGVMVQVQV